MSRVALVVGANGGIGNAAAKALAARGLSVAVAGRRLDALEQLAEGLTTSRTEAAAFPVDVTDAASIEGLIASVVDRFGGLDVAVNNAGAENTKMPLADLPVEDLDRILNTSLRGTALAMKYELGAIRDGGAIVNVSSSAGTGGGSPGLAAYAAAKHGVVGLTRVAALDYASRGIRVNAVAPGPIESGPIMALPPEVRTNVGSFVPLGRMGAAEEVGEAIAWLASDAASYVSGIVMPVDGGKAAY